MALHDFHIRLFFFTIHLILFKLSARVRVRMNEAVGRMGTFFHLLAPSQMMLQSAGLLLSLSTDHLRT